MKRILGVVIFLCGLVLAPTLSFAAVTPDAPGNFITTWDTGDPAEFNQITIPGTGFGYNYEIYWEDTASSTINGTTSVINTSSYTLTLPAPGVYEVQIAGDFSRIYFNNGGDKDKILTVEQWGSIAWTSMEGAFRGCTNLHIPATDAPDLSGVTSLSAMFSNASVFNEPINHWDVSTVSSFRNLFSSATAFNQPLNNWVTTSALDMGGMFDSASQFNQPLNTFDMSQVTSISAMFNRASAFNQDLNSWDVSKVTSMSNTFRNAVLFDGDITTWDTSSVTDMQFMFLSSFYFNQDISNWDVSKVTTFSNMFNGSDTFNVDIGDWDTSSAIRMDGMFRNVNQFNQDIGDWDVSKVTNFDYMFGVGEPVVFNQDISRWDTASATVMSNMFIGAVDFNQDLSSWNVSGVTTMENMFKDAGVSASNQDALLTAWISQPLQSNVLFYLGLKAYSSTGITALNTLSTTYDWIVTEQYTAQYESRSGATLVGSSLQKYIHAGSPTTAVEVIPDNKCAFVQWSDGSTQNPRTDTLTDNLYVLAEISCSSGSQSTSASTQREKKEAYNNTDSDNESLQATLDKVKALPDFSNLDPTKDKETISKLIELLLELVKALTLLLAASETN